MLQWSKQSARITQACTHPLASSCNLAQFVEEKREEACQTKGRYGYNAYKLCESKASIPIPIMQSVPIPLRKSYNILTSLPDQKVLMHWLVAFACSVKWARQHSPK